MICLRCISLGSRIYQSLFTCVTTSGLHFLLAGGHLYCFCLGQVIISYFKLLIGIKLFLNKTKILLCPLRLLKAELLSNYIDVTESLRQTLTGCMAISSISQLFVYRFGRGTVGLNPRRIEPKKSKTFL